MSLAQSKCLMNGRVFFFSELFVLACSLLRLMDWSHCSLPKSNVVGKCLILITSYSLRQSSFKDTYFVISFIDVSLNPWLSMQYDHVKCWNKINILDSQALDASWSSGNMGHILEFEFPVALKEDAFNNFSWCNTCRWQCSKGCWYQIYSGSICAKFLTCYIYCP